MSQAESLFRCDWEPLQQDAWKTTRQYHGRRLIFATPGLKHYETEDYRNTPQRFASVSVTGRQCALGCDHCQGRMLQSMLPAPSPASLLAQGQRLLSQGCKGILVSGGCDGRGAVPLGEFVPAIRQLKSWGLQVTVHAGLLERETAEGLKSAGVDQVLLDVVGDESTIREVFHLDRTPADYLAALALLQEVGLPIIPHVVIGLHQGELRGELAALDMIRSIEPAALVLVALRPLPHTPMAGATPISAAELARIAATARLMFPTTPMSLGCARPSGPGKVELERLAVLAGVNAVAYPDPATVRLASELGLRTAFVESCCSLAVTSQA